MPEATTSNPEPPRRPSRWWSSAWTALLIPFVFLPYRFLCLPCGIAAMLEVWPLHTPPRERLRRQATLIIGAPLVLILRTALDPAWWVPWLVFIGAIAWLARKPSARPTAAWGGPFVFLSVWIASITILWRPTPSERAAPGVIAPTAVLVCVGDSLTAGVVPGSDADTYVANLRSRLPCRVVNAGVANDKTRDVLRRLDRDVLSKKPDVVLLFVGGNDSLDGTPRATFAEQLETVATRIKASGARLVLVEVPAGIVLNPYAGVYRRVARRHHALLVPESLLRLWFSIELLARDHLKDPLTMDGIHLSPSGAKRVADWLEPYIRSAFAGVGNGGHREAG